MVIIFRNKCKTNYLKFFIISNKHFKSIQSEVADFQIDPKNMQDQF